jgi:hypothetical protein
MMKTKKKRKKNKSASNLGPLKQALAARLNLEFLLLGPDRSWEGPESCSSKMNYNKKTKCIKLNVWFIH